MQTNPGSGKLIILEGLDGAGTTTQAAVLAGWLRKKDLRVWVTREPSPGPAGAQIRSVLTRRLKMDPRTLTALFVADRLDHLYGPQGVRKHLDNGEWVIMDRYYHSSFAYQTLSLSEADQAWLWDLHEPCLIPDVTFFLDVPALVCMNRISTNRGFHFELFEKEDVLERVRSQYLLTIEKLRHNGENIQILDGTQPVKTVTKGIVSRTEELFFEATRLSILEQKTFWKQFPVMLEFRKEVEKQLTLDFLVVKKLLPSSANYGGFQLVFASQASTYYYISAYFNRDRTTLKFYASGQADGILEALQALLLNLPGPSKEPPAPNKDQLTFFQKGS